MKYCTNCGSKIQPGAKYCTNCGVDLTKEDVNHNQSLIPKMEELKSKISSYLNKLKLVLNLKTPKGRLIFIALIAVVIFAGFKVYQANEKIDPLANITAIIPPENASSSTDETFPPDVKAEIATQMRKAICKKVSHNSAGINYIEQNKDWTWSGENYDELGKIIGKNKAEMIDTEVYKLKNSLKYDIYSRQGFITYSLDIPKSEADTDGIKVADHTFNLRTGEED